MPADPLMVASMLHEQGPKLRMQMGLIAWVEDGFFTPDLG